MTGRNPGRPCLILLDRTYPDAPRVRVDIRHPDGGCTQYELLGPAAEALCEAAAELAGQAADAVRAEVERLRQAAAQAEAAEAAEVAEAAVEAAAIPAVPPAPTPVRRAR